MFNFSGFYHIRDNEPAKLEICQKRNFFPAPCTLQFRHYVYTEIVLYSYDKLFSLRQVPVKHKLGYYRFYHTIGDVPSKKATCMERSFFPVQFYERAYYVIQNYKNMLL